ncbi:hypothetical protein [Dysosmobacter welbionis]
MTRKWKILLACVVVVAAVAAMTVGICARYVLHYLAVGGDFEISFITAGETLEDITEQIDQDTLDAIKGLVLGAERGGYRVGCSPWLSESSVEINGRNSEGLWHIYLDEDTAVIYDGDRRYPLINGEELLEQLWALLPEQ